MPTQSTIFVGEICEETNIANVLQYMEEKCMIGKVQIRKMLANKRSDKKTPTHSTLLLLYCDVDDRNDGDLNKTQCRVYAEIKKNPSAIAASIAEAIGLSKPTVERAITVLKKRLHCKRRLNKVW